jgi:14-3-3 protein epsilon
MCQDVLSILDQQLIPSNPEAELRVGFLRLEGDLYRYMLEFAASDHCELYKTRANSLYNDAWKIAQKDLPPHSLARLCLVINRAAFFADFCNEAADAVAFAEAELAKLASENSEVSEELYQKAMALATQLSTKMYQWAERRPGFGAKP